MEIIKNYFKCYSKERRFSIVSLFLILLTSACVDRVSFDIGQPSTFPVVIEGNISDQPGPYKILISKAFDIESKYSIKTPVNVARVVISDGQGNQEQLSMVTDGEYQTAPNGIRGEVGHAYSLKVEFRDGRIYESIPDTLYQAGSVDSIYYNFIESKDVNGTSRYGFDIIFNSSSGTLNNFYFLWKFTGTFRADTHPELQAIDKGGCQQYNGKCNWKPICSGLVNIASPDFPPIFEQREPCSCCTCWYNIYNDHLQLSDNHFLESGRFTGIKLHTVPLNGWIFLHKLHVQVSQRSLSRQAFLFWKSIKAQKEAINSLFQPVSGKVQSNFIQAEGLPGEVYGFFYSTSESTKTLYITRQDVPNVEMIPDVADWNDSCLSLFPFGSTEKPTFWVE